MLIPTLTFTALPFHTKNKCINCTRALNKRVRDSGRTVTPEEYCQFSMEHDGPCYRKTNYSTAASEEFLSEECARGLLLDASGKPRNEDTCVFASTIVADNDSKSVKRAQRAQREIMGDVVEGLSTHDPDLNHLIKNQSNDMYDAAKKNPALRGQTGLKPLRIKSLSSDMTRIVKDLHDNENDPQARQVCLDAIDALVLHHCDDHSKCKHEKYCTFRQIKKEHSDWNDQQVREERAKQTKRFNGVSMSLSKSGIELLQKIVSKRFNNDTIDVVAKCGCSNRCEGFWGHTIKHSEGKRVLGNGTNLWYMFLQLCFCCGNGKDTERTAEELSSLLKLEVTEEEKKEHERAQKKRKKDNERHSSEKGKLARKQAKLTAAHRAGKDPNKSSHYKTEKAPIKEKKRKQSKCSKCHLSGHTARDCVLAKAPKKRKAELFDWGSKVTSTKKFTPRYKKHKPVLFDWSKSTLLKKK